MLTRQIVSYSVICRRQETETFPVNRQKKLRHGTEVRSHLVEYLSTMYENLGVVMYVHSPNTQKRWREMDENFKVKPGTPEIPTQKQAAIHPPSLKKMYSGT